MAHAASNARSWFKGGCCLFRTCKQTLPGSRRWRQDREGGGQQFQLLGMSLPAAPHYLLTTPFMLLSAENASRFLASAFAVGTVKQAAHELNLAVWVAGMVRTRQHV